MHDPETMAQEHRRQMRKPWITLPRLMIAFGIALTVLAFFLAMSGRPGCAKAQSTEIVELEDIVTIDVQDADSIRAAMDGAGYARIVLDPDRYVSSLIFCMSRLQAAFPDILTEDIGLAGVWYVPHTGQDYHALCTAKRGITIDQHNAEWLCSLLKLSALDWRDSQVVCGRTREDGKQM